MRKKTPEPWPVTHTTSQGNKAVSYDLGPQLKPTYKLPADADKLLLYRRFYYAYRRNGFMLLAVFDMCNEHAVYPPSWALVALSKATRSFQAGEDTLERALKVTKRDREEYEQYIAEGPMMVKVRKQIEKDPRRRIGPACLAVAMKHGLNPDTVEKQYRRFWKGYMDYCNIP